MSDTYFTNLRTEMLEFVPFTANTILDVGCGAGNFGAQLLKRQKAQIWGVEPDELASEEASKKLHRVINDIFRTDLMLPKKYFDCIVFNDVLEHLVNPEKALAFAKELLSDSNSSCIICSIPNFRYIKNIYDILVKKDFLYTDYGTLDKTHLRFFTQKSVVRLFEENGFKINSCVGINPSRHILFYFLNFISFNFIRDMQYLQFAVVAKPASDIFH